MVLLCMRIFGKNYTVKQEKCKKESDFSVYRGRGVAAALLTKKGSIYVGVCIDTAKYTGNVLKEMRLLI